jgi:hypothetical protein
LSGKSNLEAILLQNLYYSLTQGRVNIVCIASVEIGNGFSVRKPPGAEPFLESSPTKGGNFYSAIDSQASIQKPTEKTPSESPVGNRYGPTSQFFEKIRMAEEPIPERRPPPHSPGFAGLNMQFGDGYVMRADHLANLAVVAEFKPICGNRFFLQAEALGIRSREFGAGEKTRGPQHRAVSIADGTLDALIDVGFHKYFFTAENNLSSGFSSASAGNSFHCRC